MKYRRKSHILCTHTLGMPIAHYVLVPAVHAQAEHIYVVHVHTVHAHGPHVMLLHILLHARVSFMSKLRARC